MRVPVSLAALLVCVSLLPGLAHAQQGNDEPRVIVVPVPGEGGSDAGLPPPPPPIEQPPAPTESASKKLVALTQSCWFGGLWAGDERDPPEAKRADIDARCKDALHIVYDSDAKAKPEQLRACEPEVVADLAAKMDALSKDDFMSDATKREAIVNRLKAAGAAQREALLARRAADNVKHVGDREADKLTKDDADAIAPLSATKDLEALLAIDDPDARAIAYVTVMDRVAVARGAAKHLRVFAFSGTAKALFGTPIPANLPTDPKKPWKRGTYAKWAIEAAKSAGHPVPDTAKTPREKELLAWAGVLQGVADKVKANTEKLPDDSRFRDLSGRIATRLAAWADAEQKAAAPEPKKPKKL